MRRAALGFRIPSGTNVQRIQEERLRVGFPGATLINLDESILEVKTFDCLDEKDLPEVAKVLEDVELSASFEISFVGVKIVPNAKHPREIVSRVHLGKRPLQRLYEFVNHHHLLEKYRQQVPYVPLLKLAHFSDIKPALLEKEHILPLYFIEEIHRYRPDSIVLFDKDEKKAIMERKI